MVQTDDEEVCYISREAVQQALEDENTFRANVARIDQVIRQASRDVEGLCHRTFYPWTGTKTFDAPRRGTTLWLEQHDLLALASLSSGGTALTASDYIFRPTNELPITAIELDRSSSGSWTVGDTWQNAVVGVGTWGYTDRSVSAGTITTSPDNDDTTINVSDGSAVGVGDLLTVDTERLIVTDKMAVASGTTTTANLDAKNNANIVSVVDGSLFTAGEVLLVDAERMLVLDVVGNTLVVKRPVQGSVLAAHTSGGAVWVYRRLVVRRAATGTTAASHTAGAVVYRHTAPSLVQELTMAYAVVALTQGKAAYGRVIGAGDNQRESSGRGLKQIEADCQRRYARVRIGAA